MKIFTSYAGFFFFKDETVDFYGFGGDKPEPSNAANALQSLRNGKSVKELERMFKGLEEKEITFGSEFLLPTVRAHYSDLHFKVLKDWRLLKKARGRVAEKLEEIFGGRKEYVRFANAVSIEIARARISKAGEKKDLIIIETITVVEELAKMVNNLVSHLKDFYGYYFPELPELVENNETYLKLVAIGEKKDMTLSKLKNTLDDPQLCQKIIEEKEKSLKVGLRDSTIHMFQEIARKGLALSHLRSFLLSELGDLMREIAPNITSIVGATLGAKLIKELGGLEEMAKSPSSTIQIVGAEKALFRYLQGQGTPPKHGIIFQDPRIHSAPKEKRGKIARAIANKLALAARVDYFSNRDIGEKLNQEVKERINEIKRRE